MCIMVSERANQSLQQLSSALEQQSSDEEEEEEGEEPRGREGSLFTMAGEDRTAWSQKTQSEAGNTNNMCHTFFIIIVLSLMLFYACL